MYASRLDSLHPLDVVNSRQGWRRASCRLLFGVTLKDMLAGCQQEIHAGRDRKLEPARSQRQILASKPLDGQIALCWACGCRGSNSV